MPKKKPESAEIRRDLFPAKYVELKFNGAKAAIACGYSEKAARQQASLLLSDANIQEEIHKLVKGIHDEAESSRERLLREIRGIAYLDPLDLFNGDTGELLPINKMPENARRAIASVAINKGTTLKGVVDNLKLCSKERCLEMLAKFEKLYSDAPVIEASGDVVFNMVLHKGDEDENDS